MSNFINHSKLEDALILLLQHVRMNAEDGLNGDRLVWSLSDQSKIIFVVNFRTKKLEVNYIPVCNAVLRCADLEKKSISQDCASFNKLFNLLKAYEF